MFFENKNTAINEIELELMTNTMSDLYIKIYIILQAILFKTNMSNIN